MSAQTDTLKDKGFVPAAEAARRTGVTVYTIYRWVNDKKIDGFQVATHWFVSLASLVKHLGPKAAEALGIADKHGKVIP
jgi:excisionase family DNA binding protein